VIDISSSNADTALEDLAIVIKAYGDLQDQNDALCRECDDLARELAAVYRALDLDRERFPITSVIGVIEGLKDYYENSAVNAREVLGD
jgi:hypothetical protein